MPKVSVIIPTHNRADFLRGAISSVLNQTYQDFEIIVVDDASEDNTYEVVTSFDEPRIKYIRHEVSKGDGGARNTGIMKSRGDYLAFLDDDDEWLPEKLQMQVDLLRNSSVNVGGVYAGFLKIDKTTGKILALNIPEKTTDSFREMFVNNLFATSCVLLRRTCFEKVGLFDERIPYNSDFDMWIRIAREFYFDCIKEPLVIYHAHDRKLTTNLPLILQGHEIVLKKYEAFFALNRTSYGRLYHRLGILYSLNGDSEKSRKAFLKAIKSRPLGFKHYLALAISLLGSDVLKKFIEIKEKITVPLTNRKISQELEKVATSTLITTVRLICRSGPSQ